MSTVFIRTWDHVNQKIWNQVWRQVRNQVEIVSCEQFNNKVEDQLKESIKRKNK